MNLNIDLQTMFAFYKKGKISRYALEMKMIDHAIDKSSIRGIDVELCDDTKGFAILYLPSLPTSTIILLLGKPSTALLLGTPTSLPAVLLRLLYASMSFWTSFSVTLYWVLRFSWVVKKLLI